MNCLCYFVVIQSEICYGRANNSNKVSLGFKLISVLRPFNTFLVISGAVSYPNHTVPGQAS